jgi:hypothetical protein
MTYMTTIHPTLHSAISANLGPDAGEVEIGVRYDVECSTEHPVSNGIRVLVNVLNDMELNRPLFYFTVLGMAGIILGLNFLKTFYMGGSLSFGPTLLMIMFTLPGSFMAFTGIILHSMSRMINEAKMNREDFLKKKIDKIINHHND